MTHYSPLLWLYQIIAFIFTPFLPIFLFWRLRKGKEDKARIKERKGIASIQRPEGAIIWLHAASVGELNAAMPLIEQLNAKYPSLLVTTGTITSAQIALNRLPSGVMHQFIPLDSALYMKRFFEYWTPRFAVLIESELWPNMLLTGRKYGCNFVMVNGRMSDRSFQRWHKFAPHAMKTILAQMDICLCQTQQDADRFLHLGALRATAIGNLKYDATLPAPNAATLKTLVALTKSRHIIVAASTHEGEENTFIKMHSSLMEQYPNLLTIIVPRHPHRGAEIAELAKRISLNFSMRSQSRMPEQNCQIYIADTIGEFSLFLNIADLVFMGGSLVPVGGHNPIEPALLKKPIITGIYTDNFKEIYSVLDDHKAVVRIGSYQDFVTKAQTLLKQPKLQKQLGINGFHAVKSQQGALERTLQSLEPFLLDCAIKPK